MTLPVWLWDLRLVGRQLSSNWWRRGSEGDYIVFKCHQMETFPRYWPFVWRIHRSPVNSTRKGGALMFSLICAWINDWVNNVESGYLRRHRTHYDVNVMTMLLIECIPIITRSIFSNKLTTWISNYIHHKVRHVITYPYPNFSGRTFEYKDGKVISDTS